MMRVAGYTVACVVLGAGAIVAWASSLPRLDPRGHEDSSAAVMAMIEGRPVLNVATRWPVTKTGWPFFDRYSPTEVK